MQNRGYIYAVEDNAQELQENGFGHNTGYEKDYRYEPEDVYQMIPEPKEYQGQEKNITLNQVVETFNKKFESLETMIKEKDVRSLSKDVKDTKDAKGSNDLAMPYQESASKEEWKADLNEPISREEYQLLRKECRMVRERYTLLQDRDENTKDSIMNIATRHIGTGIPHYRPHNPLITTVPMKVNGQEIHGLIDTGASITLCDASIAQDLGLQIEESPKGTSFKGINGQSVAAKHIARATLQIGNVERDIVLYLTNDAHMGYKTQYDCIIGGDSLRKLGNLTVNHESRQVTIGGNITGGSIISMLTNAERKRMVKKLYIKENCEVPSKSVLTIQAYVEKDPQEDEIDLFHVTGTADKMQCQLTPAIGKVERGMLMVKVHNDTDEPIKLYRNQTLGYGVKVFEKDGRVMEYPEPSNEVMEWV